MNESMTRAQDSQNTQKQTLTTDGQCKELFLFVAFTQKQIKNWLWKVKLPLVHYVRLIFALFFFGQRPVHFPNKQKTNDSKHEGKCNEYACDAV